MVKQYYLKDKNPEKVTPDAGELNVKLNSTTVFTRSNRIYLAFQLNTKQPQKSLLYAVGPYGQLPTAKDELRLKEHRDKDSASLDYTTGKVDSY